MASRTFQEYRALWQHFDPKSSYDYFKYRGRIRGTSKVDIKHVMLCRKMEDRGIDCPGMLFLAALFRDWKFPYFNTILSNFNEYAECHDAYVDNIRLLTDDRMQAFFETSPTPALTSPNMEFHIRAKKMLDIHNECATMRAIDWSKVQYILDRYEPFVDQFFTANLGD